MFDWMRRRLDRRNIFRFHNGTSWVYGDPIVIDRHIEATCPDWRILIGFLVVPEVAGGLPPLLLEQARNNQRMAIEKLVSAVRRAFGAPPLDDRGRGLTESECLNLLASFVDFTRRLVEAAGPFLVSSGPVEASPAVSTIPPSADFTSGASASPSDRQPSSPTA